MRVDGAPIRESTELIWLADLAAHWAQLLPDKMGLVFEDRRFTYADVDRGAARLCAAWQDQGLRPGDRIGYLGRNSDLLYFALLACAKGRFLFVPYNWRYAAPELAFVLADSLPALLIHDDEFAPLIEAAATELTQVPPCLFTEGAGGLRSLLDASSGRTPLPVAYDRTDPLIQIYTSGTTGNPKGALLSHGAISLYRRAYADTPQWEDWSSDEIILSAMPNFHIAGIGFVLAGFAAGATVVHTADPSPRNLIKISLQHSVNRIYMVPTTIRLVLEELEATGETAPRYDMILYGAQPVGPLLERAINAFGCRFSQYYGMTEAATTHVLGPADHDRSRPHLMNSVGRPIAGVSSEIRRPDLTVCREREHGEIWIRSVMIMTGYVNRPDATAAALVDGWYRTGDGGYVDEDGYLYLTDRLKEMVISGGENVYPVEVENALKSHPGIRDVAVIGVSDPKWGEAVTAVIELKPEADPTFGDLRAFVRARIAGYKCPTKIYVAEALPRTPLGKVQRGVTRAMLASFRRLED